MTSPTIHRVTTLDLAVRPVVWPFAEALRERCLRAASRWGRNVARAVLEAIGQIPDQLLEQLALAIEAVLDSAPPGLE